MKVIMNKQEKKQVPRIVPGPIEATDEQIEEVKGSAMFPTVTTYKKISMGDISVEKKVVKEEKNEEREYIVNIDDKYTYNLKMGEEKLQGVMIYLRDHEILLIKDDLGGFIYSKRPFNVSIIHNKKKELKKIKTIEDSTTTATTDDRNFFQRLFKRGK